MKNIVYIFLVSTLLVGCKGSSFLTQRYTNYGHGMAKKSERTKSEGRAQKGRSEATVKNTVPQPTEANKADVVVTGNSKATKPESKFLPVRVVKHMVKLPKKFMASNFLESKPSVSEDASQLDDKTELRSDVKADKSQKASAAKAIVGKILKIIILLLLLGVLVLVFVILSGLGLI